MMSFSNGDLWGIAKPSICPFKVDFALLYIDLFW